MAEPRKAHAQDILHQARKVVWGGSSLLFLYATFETNASTAPQSAEGPITGLPEAWGTAFDIFATDNRLRDPLDVGPSVPIVDPVTVAMVSRYRMWTPHEPVNTVETVVGPGGDDWIIDTAFWDGRLNGVVIQVMEPFQEYESTRAAGLAALIEFYGPGVGTAPDYPEYALALHEGVMPPGADGTNFFYTGTAHLEHHGGAVTNTRKTKAVLIINLAKLRAALPDDPAQLPEHKKPEEFTFRVGMNTGQRIKWKLQGSVYPLTERKTFPLDGTLKPTWLDFPDAEGGLIDPAHDPSVDVTVNFVTNRVTMVVNGYPDHVIFG